MCTEDVAVQKLLVRRSEEGLNRLMTFIDRELTNIAATPRDITADKSRIETVNLLRSARLMAEAANARKESRGAHYRTDYPVKADAYGKPMIQRKADHGSILTPYEE